MKSNFVALAIVLAGIPALAWGQAPCGCSPRSASVIRQASHEVWSDYQPVGGPVQHGGCGCAEAVSCCRPARCQPLLCIIPNTVRKIGRTLDCLLPCGPRSGHGCGISCIGAGSGCMGISCCRGVGHHPSCTSPVMGDPFRDDEALPAPAPSPPKPMTEDTRRQPTRQIERAPRQLASAPAAAGKQSPQARPATKSVTRARVPNSRVNQANLVAPVTVKQPVSVLKRTSATSEDEELQPVASNPRRPAAAPRNPLR